MRKLFSLSIFLLILNFGFAQYQYPTKQKYLPLLKNSILIIPVPDNVRLITDSNRLGYDKIKNKLTAENRMLIDVIQKYWNYNNKIELRPFFEADSLADLPASKYIMVCFDVITEANNEPQHILTRQNNNPIGEPGTTTSPAYRCIVFRAKKVLARALLPKFSPSYADLVYGIMQIRSFMRYLDQNPHMHYSRYHYYISTLREKLTSKTLLFDHDLIDSNLTVEKIRSLYPFPFRIADRHDIDSAIIRRDSSAAYTQLVPVLSSRGTQYNLSVNSAANGDVLYVYRIVLTPNHPTLRPRFLWTADIQYLADYLAYRVPLKY